MELIWDYFNLASGVANFARSQQPPDTFPVWPQYLVLVAGIVVQPFFTRYQTNGTWDLKGMFGWIIAAMIIGVCVFPLVYKNAIDPGKPLFVQLCMIFVSGMGWQSLFQTAVKTLPAGKPNADGS